MWNTDVVGILGHDKMKVQTHAVTQYGTIVYKLCSADGHWGFLGL